MTTYSSKRTIAMNRLMIATLAVLLTASAARAQDEVIYYHTDALGSVRMTTDANGAEIARYDYMAFGETPPNAPPNASPDVRQFTGKERDSETGLDYFGARYYRGASGRFTTVDPVMNIEAALSDPQRWNRYAYGSNNPLRNIDPDGRDTLDLAIGFGQGIWNTAKGVVTLPYALATDFGGVVGGLAQDFQLMWHGGTHPGEVIDAYVALAVSSNDADQRALGAAVGQGTAAAALTVAGGSRAGTTKVIHFTDAAGKAGIEASGSLQAGSWVTKPSQVRGMTTAQIEARLEIGQGKGANSFTARVPNSNLAVPANGAKTSGGAWQRQLKKPTEPEKQ